jgi:hypothetical protein
MVDLEHPQPPHQRRAASEGVQAGAEDHVLVQAAAGQLAQALLGVAAAHGHLRAGAGQHDVVAAAAVVADHLLARFPEQRHGRRVPEDQRLLVDHQVGGTAAAAASAVWLGPPLQGYPHTSWAVSTIRRSLATCSS